MYPVTLEIKGRRCLVVGGGAVALRKVQGLVEEGALVTVVSPEVVDPVAMMADRGEIVLEKRPYGGEAAGGWSLIIAATDNREVNEQVFRDAEDHGIWCNVADVPEMCSFHLPARVRRGPFQMAISSAGEAPFAVARLRRLMERRFGPEWAEWLDADLAKEVEAGRFREDLFYRLSGVPIRIPPLRERLEDVPLLVSHFAKRSAAENGVAFSGVAPRTIEILQRYSWPGNVRELAHDVERAVILGESDVLVPEDFDRTRFGLAPSTPGPVREDIDEAPPISSRTDSGQGEPRVFLDTFNLSQAEAVLIQKALDALDK